MRDGIETGRQGVLKFPMHIMLIFVTAHGATRISALLGVQKPLNSYMNLSASFPIIYEVRFAMYLPLNGT